VAERITVYQKPACNTCRQVHAALQAAGADFDAVDYYVEPLTRERLADLVRKIGVPARSLLRTHEEIFSTLHLGERAVPDDEAIDLMVRHPDLMQRPIVERGARAILARPADRITALLKGSA
jgi:arsenate reductase